jgi:hypothetical protein
MCGTIILGSGSTILSKRLDIIGFYYPFFQTGLMFLGEAACSLVILLLAKKEEKQVTLESSGSEKEVQRGCFEKSGKYIFCVTAMFDFLGSFMEYFSYNLLKASVIVTFKMMVIVFIIIYRVYFLKRILYKHQKLGLVFLAVGFILVGSEVSLNSSTHFKYNKNALLGIFFMIIAQAFNALVIIFQETQMGLIEITPQTVITIQGISGLLICSILYAPLKYLFNFIGYNITDMQTPFIKFKENDEVCILICFLLVVIGLLNIFQVKTIKVADSLSLCTIDSGRVILVWIMSIAFSFESALPVELIGGGSLVFGIIIYNEVIVLPCCGMKKSVRVSMKESQIYRELKIKDRLWQNNFDSIL